MGIMTLNLGVDSFWNSADYNKCEYICDYGMRKLLELPEYTLTIYACTTDKKPNHDHWFRLRDNWCHAIDFSDDEHDRTILDDDFSRWLWRQYQAGDDYLTIKYLEEL